MTDLRDVLRSAADAAPRPDDLLATAYRKAGQRQRRQRSAWAGGTLLVVAGAVGAGVALPRGASTVTGASNTVSPTPATTPSATATTSAPAPSGTVAQAPVPTSTTAAPATATSLATPSTRDCFEGFSAAVPASSLAAELGLLSADPSYHLKGGVQAGQMTDNCPAAAIPLVYQQVINKTVTRSLSLTGPIPQSPPGAQTPTYAGAVSTTVRGTAGQAVTLSSSVSMLNWAEPDGTHWSLEGSGLSKAELLKVANGLTLSGTVAADPATLPAGMQQQPPVPAATTDTWASWSATYVQGKTTFQLQIEQKPGGVSAAMLGAAAGNRVVTVLGHSGQLNTDSGGGHADDAAVSLEWTAGPDVLASVIGNGLTDKQLEDFAATLTPVAASDPRLR